MATIIKTLYEGTITLPDLYTYNTITRVNSKQWRLNGYKFSGVTVSTIKLYFTDKEHVGYAKSFYVILQHNTVTGTSASKTYSSSVSAKRPYIASGITVDDAGRHGYSNTLSVKNKINSAYNFRSGSIDINCPKSSSKTYTINSLLVDVGSTAIYPTEHQVIYTYDGDPLTYEIPQKTVSKIEVNNGSHSGISVDYLDDDWYTTNYFTIGDTKTLPDVYDRNGKWEFEGWYLDSDLTEPAPTSFEVTFDDLKLYTKWKQVQPRVIIGVNGGLKQGEIRIRKGNEIITPWKGYKKINGIWRPIS